MMLLTYDFKTRGMTMLNVSSRFAQSTQLSNLEFINLPTGSQKSPETTTSQEEEEEEKKTSDGQDGKAGRVNPFKNSPQDIGDDLPIMESCLVKEGVILF